MVVMTAKVNKKRVILVLAALAALIVSYRVLAKGGGKDAPAAPQEQPDWRRRHHDARVQYLSDYGWEVVASPVQTQQVRIPSEVTEVYERYNALQMSQGFDLTQYAGKNSHPLCV